MNEVDETPKGTDTAGRLDGLVGQHAEGLLDFLESDFGQSGRDVRLEAIRCELEWALEVGRNAVQPNAKLSGGPTPNDTGEKP